MAQANKIVVFVFKLFKGFLQIIEFLFEFILLDLIPDLIFFHSIENMFITFASHHGIVFFKFDIIDNIF